MGLAPCRCHVRRHRRTNNQPTNTNVQSPLHTRIRIAPSDFTVSRQCYSLPQILASRIIIRASEPCLTPCRTSERKRSLLSLLCHSIPPAHARELTGLPQNSMIDDPALGIHPKVLSDPCTWDHHAHHRNILDTVTENFRAHQEPSLHLSGPTERQHLI